LDLATVIVSYNVRDLTLGCIASVEEAMLHDGLDGGIWVVDNASADGSAAAVQMRFPRVALIASGRNLGFAGGANLGLQAALAQDPARSWSPRRSATWFATCARIRAWGWQARNYASRTAPFSTARFTSLRCPCWHSTSGR